MKDHSEAVTARKVVQLFQLPRILVLHLKRFSYTLNGTGKIHKPINYGERLRCGLSESRSRHCQSPRADSEIPVMAPDCADGLLGVTLNPEPGYPPSGR